ncbi:hypothetical protein BHYA_0255g00030 [Botrytis hyacinthi]|uniref:Heterokaryon incompatibility domain-containing protein n=1 Tax=Botrytis hyacinthi TaxID=278943 RepID=A0A4Z1G8U2_9HELO|nr:hypothetical protein BHYA_0255g00030 [Botrytis hyacinthi]
MDCTTSSDALSDGCEESNVSEEEIHEAVLAAGKKAKNLCSFLYSIKPEVEEGNDEEYFPLQRSTARHLFGFDRAYKDSIVFYLVDGHYARISSSDFTDSVFGFSNADAYKDGVAIRNLSLQADLSLVREWIRLCDNNHAGSNFNCLPKDGISVQGFTVIDCKDGRNILVPGATCMEYITLSYVWGSEVSEGPDQSGKLPSTLPNLITDVIKVVIALGYRYLWIDRYCVPQDDYSDIKSLLIKNMDKIYSQSTLTIIATAAKCPSENLPGVSKPRIAVQKFLQLNSVRLVQWVSEIRHEIDDSVWNTRGWIYQEALLSRRRLVFTETQCYFQCDARGTWSGKGGSRMESIDYDLSTERRPPRRYRIPMIFLPRPEHYIGREVSSFGSMVSEYTKRQLSKDSDVLPAFLSVLTMFISECSGFHAHIHGVPIFEPGKNILSVNATGTLIMGITWYFKTNFRTLEDVAAAAIPFRRRSLPSWTWCDWTHASPSLYPIRWKEEFLNKGTMGQCIDIVHGQKLSLEFENGTILPWPREADLADIAQKIMLTGDVHFIHVLGWLTYLPVPISSKPEQRRQVCGRYRTNRVTEHWLLRLARERGMNVTDREEYVFKTWVYASWTESSLYSGGPRAVFYMMVLGETSDPTTFERIELCDVSISSYFS